ncbi:hypothetical protein [Mycobacterium gastri]|uniref:hypothetical protein n=1 Tax=Mycobacterium gastri TaxID=1777 RepID=UPI00313454AA
MAQLPEKNLDGSPLGDALKCLPGEPIHHVKSAVLHLLWRQELKIPVDREIMAQHHVNEDVCSIRDTPRFRRERIMGEESEIDGGLGCGA